MQRQFTIMAFEETEVLSLNTVDLNRMKVEFIEQYDKLFFDAIILLRRTWLAKLKAMKKCRYQNRHSIIKGGRRFSSE